MYRKEFRCVRKFARYYSSKKKPDSNELHFTQPSADHLIFYGTPDHSGFLVLKKNLEKIWNILHWIFYATHIIP